LQRKLEQLWPGRGARDPQQLVRELLETGLPQFEKDLVERQKDLNSMSAATLAGMEQGVTPALPTIVREAQAINAGEQKYTSIPAPVLAIYAVPRDPSPAVRDNLSALTKFEAANANREAQAKAFEIGVPSAHVVRLAHANHYVFLSNEADVLREMNAFLTGLA
jgi:non-heme chloroperoxidase